MDLSLRSKCHQDRNCKYFQKKKKRFLFFRNQNCTEIFKQYKQGISLITVNILTGKFLSQNLKILLKLLRRNIAPY